MADIESKVREYGKDGTFVYLKINGISVIDEELMNDGEALYLAEELILLAAELVAVVR